MSAEGGGLSSSELEDIYHAGLHILRTWCVLQGSECPSLKLDVGVGNRAEQSPSLTNA